MTLPSSGTITIAQIQTEFGGSNPASLSEYYRNGAYVPDTSANSSIPTSGTITMANFYGGNGATTSGTFSAANFTTQSNVSRNGTYTSNNLTLSVTNGPITVSTSGAGSPQIQQGSTGSYASTQSIANGNTVRMQLTSSASYSTSVAGTASMNGDGAVFTITTRAAPAPPPPPPPSPSCLAATEPVFIYGSGIDQTVADLVAGDKVNAFHSPTMIDESNPNWESWSAVTIADGSNVTTDVMRADQFLVGRYIVINGQVKCTEPHMLLVQRGGLWQWMRANALEIGDNLYGINGSSIPITSLETVNEQIQVVDVGAETVDTYFAGKIDGVYILNHNK